MDNKNLLRPPVEKANAYALAATSLALFTFPWMIPTGVAQAFGTVTGVLAVREYRAARKVEKFQKYIRSPSAFTMLPEDIPRSSKVLWLGKGFTWKPIHTQRLYDARNDPFYTSESAIYEWLRDNEAKSSYTQDMSFSAQFALPFRKKIAWLSSRNSALNPWAPRPDLGGFSAIHGVEPNERDKYQEIGERNGHTLVVGTTRVGKTRAAEVFIAQDIARRNKQGDFEAAVAIFDPKGDGELFARAQIEAERNGRPFYVIHLGFPEISCRYNGVAEFLRVSECATRTAGQLNSNGDGAAFKEFVWRFINIISQALFTMGETNSFEKINKHIQNMDLMFVELANFILDKYSNRLPYLSDWKTTVQMLEENPYKGNDRALAALSSKAYALYCFLNMHPELFTDIEEVYATNLQNLKHCVTHYDSTYFSKITASLLPLLEKLCSGRVAEIISPDYNDLQDPRPIISWPKVLREKAVIYIGLDAMQDTAVSTAVGNTMFADLLSQSGQIYKFGENLGVVDADHDQKTAIYVHADEFNELVGDEFLPLCNKAGGSGVKLTCYTQSRFDLDAKVGTDKSEVILSNFNTLIMMRVKTATTAKLLTEQLPQYLINDITEVSGASTDLDGKFTAKNEDRKTKKEVIAITESDIINMPKGHAFVLHNGSRLDKVRFPFLENDKSARFKALKQSKLVQQMKDRYSKFGGADEWWKTDDSYDWTQGFKKDENYEFEFDKVA
ncbi:conjugative transfer system coupling protein TraD [Vibrio tubiashii]|uniref:conjugative transfer system coupling protein TraD n=1 Tax=Vibrio tubiashii TaxID=29498 RepID=UPI001EFE40CC|nr:conjugative transfer system coupling protein TraD [Vibrio tubiashii]MCG9576727.1 conjugative transfer system coupling protein TraD [Vibrio tubiashii]